MAALTKLERMYKHIVEGLVDDGKPLALAEEIAARTVNKHRAKLARRRKGPKLVTRGGSRRQWYPGKKTKGKLYCLKHHKRFKTAAAYKSHMRSKRHRRRA